MPELLRYYPDTVYMGKVHGEKIYLRLPTWECGWYWSFGCLGNKDNHYHLDSLHVVDERVRNQTLYDQLLTHFGGTEGAVLDMKFRDTLWTFCEIVRTLYALAQTAEVLGRGGSSYAFNPCKDLIKNPEEVKRINEVVIPKLIDEMYVALGVVDPM